MANRIRSQATGLQAAFPHRALAQGTIELIAFIVARMLQEPRRNYKDKWVNTRDLALQAQASRAAHQATEPQLRTPPQRTWGKWVTDAWSSVKQTAWHGLQENAALHRRLVLGGAHALIALDRAVLSLIPRFPGAASQRFYHCPYEATPDPSTLDCEWNGDVLERIAAATNHQLELLNISDLASTPMENLTLYGNAALRDCLQSACPDLPWDRNSMYRITVWNINPYVYDIAVFHPDGGRESVNLPRSDLELAYWFSSRVPPKDNSTAIVEGWYFDISDFARQHFQPLVIFHPVQPPDPTPVPTPATGGPTVVPAGIPAPSFQTPGASPATAGAEPSPSSGAWIGGIIVAGIGGILIGAGGTCFCWRRRQAEGATEEADVLTRLEQALRKWPGAHTSPAESASTPQQRGEAEILSDLADGDSVVSTASSSSYLDDGDESKH